jgi:L-ribulokinase
MTQKPGGKLVLGIDYGTDSCRGVIIDAADGSEIAQAVAPYPRWAKGLYCDPLANRFRQHPLDYVESLESVMKALLASAGAEALAELRGIAIDTTGSTPCAVDSSGRPLALSKEFAEDPDAMFVLW